MCLVFAFLKHLLYGGKTFLVPGALLPSARVRHCDTLPLPAMLWRDVEVPEVYRGLVIGKGGEKMKWLQASYQVKIRIDENGTRVGGRPENVTACIEEIQSLIQHHARKAKTQEKLTCPLCGNVDVTTLRPAVNHLRGQKHWMKLVEAKPQFGEVCDAFPLAQLDFADLGRMLLEPQLAAYHRELNFKVDEIVEAMPALQQGEQKLQEVSKQVARLSADPNWLKIQSRVVVHWDDSHQKGVPTHKLTKAPQLVEMLQRISIWNPPVVKIPQLPSPLPEVKAVSLKSNNLKGAHKYPAEPGSSRMCIAVATKLGMDLTDYDFVCGTSFIRAMAGDSNYLKDTFYLQRLQQTACVLHVPSRFHDQNQAGHAVERLLCGDAHSGAPGSYLFIEQPDVIRLVVNHAFFC